MSSRRCLSFRLAAGHPRIDTIRPNMRIERGSRLGEYEVVERLGNGGMGRHGHGTGG